MKLSFSLLKPRTILCLILTAMIVHGTMPPSARAQNEDLDALFNDDEENGGEPPPGTFNPAPPPPPPGAGNDFSPPGGGNTFDAGGTGSPSSKGGGAGKKPKAAIRQADTKTPAPKKGDGKKPNLADASIEDITNENYPDLIESFDYPNAEITDVIKAMSQLTGKDFIVDPAVHGKITIIAPSQITVAEAWKAFLAALAVNQFTVVPYGKFLKIESTRNAMHDSIDTYSGKYYPDSDILITKIVHLKHISADEVYKNFRSLVSRDGEMLQYAPTNALLLTDHGSNIDRMMKIIDELDKPGFEEELSVVPIRYAKAKDLAELINQIINKSPTKGNNNNPFGNPGAPQFGAGAPRFGARGGPGNGSTEELSLVAPDDRTNALIVVGNKAGIVKIKDLVKKLDYKLDPAEAGGVFVYYVRYGDAEKLASVLTGVTGGQSSTPGAGGAGGGFGGPGGFRGGFAPSPLNTQAIFGGDVKINPDKNTNSLVITASQVDYHQVLDILSKLDIPKDQVFVEAIIMEMSSVRKRDWNPNYYGFKGDPNGIGRSGFLTSPIANLLNPATDTGVVLGFGSQNTFSLNIGGQQVQVPNLISFINLIQQNTDTNILSTPRILAQDNEDSEITVGDKLATSVGTATLGNSTSVTQQPTFEDVSITLKITPYIRPDSEVVRMKVEQTVKQPNNTPNPAAALAATTVTVSNRQVKTNISIHSGDTAVLGGLVHDQDTLIESKVPILGDIPILGWLFKSKQHDTNKNNLVMFLTPKIIRTLDDSHGIINRITNDRIDWIKKNFDGRDPYGKTIDSLPRATNAAAGVESDQPVTSSKAPLKSQK